MYCWRLLSNPYTRLNCLMNVGDTYSCKTFIGVIPSLHIIYITKIHDIWLKLHFFRLSFTPAHLKRLNTLFGSDVFQTSLKILKGVIKSCNTKKERQYNGQKKKNKRTNNNSQNITQKTKDRATWIPLKTGNELKCVLRKDRHFLLYIWHSSWYSSIRTNENTIQITQTWPTLLIKMRKE
jgi:hypothetical protein